jgi:hypothetical protein
MLYAPPIAFVSSNPNYIRMINVRNYVPNFDNNNLSFLSLSLGERLNPSRSRTTPIDLATRIGVLFFLGRKKR